MTVQLSRLITSAEIDASKYKAGADQKVAADRAMVASAQAVGQAASATDTKISQSGDALARLSRQYVEGFSAQQRFEAGLGSLNRGLSTGKISLEQAQTILVGMNQKLGLSANASELAARGQTQLAAAVGAANAQIQGQALAAEKSIATAKRLQAANANVAGGARSFASPNAFSTANIAAQFQDIGITAAMGQSPLQIALQQGTQLSAVLGPMGAAGAAKALGSALLSVVSPASLITLALVGGTAAAVQYFMKGREGTKTLDAALKAHEAQVKLIEEGWGKATIAEQKYGKRSASAASFGFEMSTTELRAQLRKQVPDVLSSIASATSENLGDIGGARAFRNTALFKLLSAEIGDLVEKAKNGQPDIIGLTQRIEELGDAATNQGIRNLADDIANAIRPVEELARRVLEANKRLEELRRNVGPGGLPLRGGALSTEDMGAFDQFNAAERVSADRRRQASEAQLQGIYARSPEERAAAARAAAAAQYNNDESAAARRDRIETAGKLALAEANHTLAEAQKSRANSLDQTLAAQQLDLTLIGKTAGETARLRMEFEQIAQVREDAARNGIAADENEIARIKEKAAAYGRFADEIARANLARDLGFERDQLFRSPQDQQIASRLQGAGLAVDLNSPAAQQMRDIAKFADAKGLAAGFLTDFKSEMLRSGGDIGEALGNSILNALTKSMDDQLGRIFDSLATWFASAITGQQPSGAAAFGTVGGFASMLGVGANDNYAPGAVTRSPLAALGAAGGSALSMVGNYKAGVDARLTDILDTAAKQFPGYKVDAFSGFRPGDSRFHGKGLATDVNLTDLATGKSLANYQNASTFRTYEQFAQTAREVQLAKYPKLSDQFRWGGYFGGPKGKYGAMDQMHFDLGGGRLGMGGGSWERGLNASQRAMFPGVESFGMDAVANKASAAIDKMSTNAISASENLGGLGSSVTSAADALTGGIGGKGGLVSILDSLKPENFQANTSLSAILGYGGGAAAPAGGGGGGIFSALLGFIPKLFGFADGTDFAPGGLARINEKGGEIIDLPRGSRVIPHDVSMRMAANGNRSTQQSKIDLHVNVIGGSGDEHIRKLAQQGAQEAIGQYHEGQTRGGFGDVQRRYASQKG
ncbi:phage tail length tape measure family protein [Mesorhizobium sp.]|uniref:phage tail length tape measure family protein n=1 Tax=Mesorhizobium sp. TaxID=1871066 RepID=UPI001205F575|nr:phage tail length tape measure family protein [Mesorhizobium sp.]TIP07795.1 MAG: hypothetical protein E5X73_35215 [Mesorhizobium sp.]